MFAFINIIYIYICFVCREIPAKKIRQGRASKQQTEAMVDYLIAHLHVASGKFISLHGKENLQGSWEELAAQLNAMSKYGKIKDVTSWKCNVI